MKKLGVGLGTLALLVIVGVPVLWLCTTVMLGWWR